MSSRCTSGLDYAHGGPSVLEVGGLRQYGGAVRNSRRVLERVASVAPEVFGFLSRLEARLT
jgi:hypothetical protein